MVMPMSSARNPAAPAYQIYFATRAGSAAPFGAPVPVDELDAVDRLTVDGFLTNDGLALFYSAASESPARDAAAGEAGVGASDAGVTFDSSDLFVAVRRSTDEPFEVVQALTDLNTSASERDPWLSPDGRTFYFTSDRDGVPNIYSVGVRPR
jgi:hypothetical protein